MDNILVTPGSGACVAADEVSGVLYQRVKATFGVDGVATDVSALNPLPVTMAASGGGLTNTELRATPVPISGTVAVSGTVPVSIAGTVAVSGGLTDTQLRATALPVSGTVTANAGTGTMVVSAASLPLPSGAATSAKQAALGTAGTAATDVLTVQGIASMTALKVDGSGVTQPVSGTVTANAGTGTFAVSGPLTDTQLRASAVPMSLAALPALVAGTALVGKVGIDQTTPGTTNKVSIGTDGTVAINAAIPTGANVIGALTANQSVNQTQVNGVAMLAGNGVTGTGSMRVTIASDNTAFSVNAVQSGAWSLTANQSVNMNQVGGTAVATNSGVVGAGTQRVVLATDVALPAGTNTLGTTTGPTLTKATQGSTGYSTQDLKDAGRAILNAATAIAGVTAATTEALLALNVSRDGAATSSVTTIAVTSGKRLRITHMVVGFISTAAAVLSGRFSLRMNPSGAAAANSPIMATLPIPSGAALAQAGGSLCITIPDGIEFSGTQQIGISQVCSAITGTIWATLIGFEY